MTPVEIFTTAICPFCVSAKSFLTQKGLQYTEIAIDIDPLRRAEMLQRSGGRRSVPQIFINGTHVGGYEELVAADRSGRLQELAESGA